MPLFNKCVEILITHIQLDEYIKISHDTRIKKMQNLFFKIAVSNHKETKVFVEQPLASPGSAKDIQ